MVQQHLSGTVGTFFGAFSLVQELQEQVSDHQWRLSPSSPWGCGHMDVAARGAQGTREGLVSLEIICLLLSRVCHQSH